MTGGFTSSESSGFLGLNGVTVAGDKARAIDAFMQCREYTGGGYQVISMDFLSKSYLYKGRKLLAIRNGFDIISKHKSTENLTNLTKNLEYKS